MGSDPVRTLVARWRDDPDGTYRTWFLWEERLKNFRSIRRGLVAVVKESPACTYDSFRTGNSNAIGTPWRALAPG